MNLEAPLGPPEKGTPPWSGKSCLARQLQLREELARSKDKEPLGFAITISHLAGSGAHEVAEDLMALLQDGQAPEARPWTLFDRHLLKQVLADHHLPLSLTEFLGEDPQPYLRDVVDDLLGVIPPSWDMVPRFTETVLNLVGAGHVILVGRAASFITASLPHVFHAHLIASSQARILRRRTQQGLTQAEAAEQVAREDQTRDRFVEDHFGSPLEETLSYHLTLNTDRIPPEACAVLIAMEAEAFWRRQAHIAV